MGGETLGFPNWFPFPQQNIWDVFLPNGVGCDFGACVPNIGFGLQAQAPVIAVEACLESPPCVAAVMRGVAVAGLVLNDILMRRQSTEWTDRARREFKNTPPPFEQSICGWYAWQLTLPENQDPKRKLKIVEAQKYDKCRNVRKR